jgi:hypothetical protein
MRVAFAAFAVVYLGATVFWEVVMLFVSGIRCIECEGG